MELYRISRFAEMSGVDAATLRFYDRFGLLSPQRSEAGYRLYDDGDLERLRFITACRHLGLTLVEVRDLLRAWDDGLTNGARQRMRPTLLDRVREVDVRLAELEAFRELLQQAVDDVQQSDVDAAGSGGPMSALASIGSVAAATACRMTPAAQAVRATRWRRVLGEAEPERVTGGLHFRLPAELAHSVAELAARDQRCCTDYDFKLRLSSGVLHFEVRASSDAARTMAEVFGVGR